MSSISGKTVAIITENGFEESEFIEPKKALEDAGATVHVVSPQKDKIVSWKDGNWGSEFKVDKHISEVTEGDYDAVVIPGGVINPDHLRRSKEAVDFIGSFIKEGKPVAAICHGPQVLIETGLLRGRELTSFHSVKTDIVNAGGKWIDDSCVCDQGLVTSRNPGDLPDFNRKMIEEIKEGQHKEQKMT
ncbi:type 1 glutamine amidotransferase domain-containing protein [Negadavirga shengliensis]|uniref:Type 1 glutamine amidotransferase domain-containing protein n=1 Tax=Negadavirga shengliensis TaxID=1389218 RepID=A0ABV9T2B3_9BACT